MTKKYTSNRFTCVYVLYSLITGDVYVGVTGDLKTRLASHHQGSVPSSRDLRPLLLLSFEYFMCKTDALKREAFLKSAEGRRHLAQHCSEALSICKNKRRELRNRLGIIGTGAPHSP